MLATFTDTENLGQIYSCEKCNREYHAEIKGFVCHGEILSLFTVSVNVCVCVKFASILCQY